MLLLQRCKSGKHDAARAGVGTSIVVTRGIATIAIARTLFKTSRRLNKSAGAVLLFSNSPARYSLTTASLTSESSPPD